MPNGPVFPLRSNDAPATNRANFPGRFLHVPKKNISVCQLQSSVPPNCICQDTDFPDHSRNRTFRIAGPLPFPQKRQTASMNAPVTTGYKKPFHHPVKKAGYPDHRPCQRVKTVSKQCQFCVNDTALPLENDTSTRIVPSLITLFAFFFHPRETIGIFLPYRPSPYSTSCPVPFFAMLSTDRTIRVTWPASGTGLNEKRTEHSVFKRKKRKIAVTDHTARTRNTKKREDSRLESLPVKKRIDLISQSELFNAYSMPIFQKIDRDQKKRCFFIGNN